MHVAWFGLFDGGGLTPSVTRLRESIGGRLKHTPKFRRRLAFPPRGMGEPFWVDDAEFDIRAHVTTLGPKTLTRQQFEDMADGLLSKPLDRNRPLWHVYLAPRLEGGGSGVLCKMHHALVDGKSAVEVALLLFDMSADAQPEPPGDWIPEPEPGTARLALQALERDARESFRAARDLARLAGSPGRGGGRIADTLRRAALSVGDDVLRPAPSSYVNVPIGPRRTLVKHRVQIDDLLAIKKRAVVTLNDVCLAVVAGGMRELAMARGEPPIPLKVMVPVSLRTEDQRDALGNQISFAFIDLPVQESRPMARLRLVNQQTRAFKDSGRAEATGNLVRGLGILPPLVRDRAAKAAGSSRIFNLTVSNIPGPRFPLYMLGSQLVEAYPVVPIPEDHALSIGIFTNLDRLFFGIYADPQALPDAADLPGALSVSLLQLDQASRQDGSTPCTRPAGRISANGTIPAAATIPTVHV
jgi:WS/DGAT/MGAT family acyltransferase